MHDVIVLAGSCVLSTWFIDLAREVAAASDPQVEFHFWDGDDVLPDVGRSEGPPRIVIVVGPNSGVIDAILSRSSLVIGIIDDPVDSVRYLLERRGISLLEALRVQTKYACAHEYLFENPCARLIRRGSSASARETAEDALALIGPHLEAPRRMALLDEFGGPADDPWPIEVALQRKVDGYVDLARVAKSISAENVAVIRGVLSPLILGAITRNVAFMWMRPVFLSGDDPTAVVAPVADVTGEPRIIFFGPYFHLASGDWVVKLLVAFSDRVKGTPFQLRLLCMQDTLSQVVLKPDDGGIFHGAFRIHHSAPERWLELQFSTVEGMIEGEVAIGQIEFQRAGPTVSQDVEPQQRLR